jgi:hypothetical protein
MMKKIWIVLLVLALVACLRLDNAPVENIPTATATHTPNPTNTPTVVWFPPTETPVVTPTREVTPTPGVMAELGEIIYEDDFNSPEGWILPESGRGLITVGNGELNIIINEPSSYLSSTREKPDVGNFYAEITTNPVLCSSRDEYGFLFGVYGGIQYYTFGLSCSGEVRLLKFESGNFITLLPWTRNASVPAGAPSVTRIAVLAVDDEIQIYINGEPLFSIEGQQRRFGSFGVYARSVGDTAVTVSFKDFIVREVLPE